MGLLSSSGLTSTPTTSTQTSVGAGGQPYATDLLAKGQALVNNPAPAYGGQLTAGASDIQNQAWQGLSNLTLPSALTNASNNLQDIGARQAGMTYSGPSQTNQYQGTQGYNSMNVTGGTFDANNAQQYMNPYLQQSLNPQLAEIQRQYGITGASQQGDATKAGAFGGSREAIMAAENERNKNTAMNQAIGSGYNTAFQQAQQQYNADQARNMQAQQANVQQKQFASQQDLANAQNQAQYGQAAQAANLQNAQFGANFGLQGLQNAATSQQAAANAGAQQAQYGLQNLQALSTAGNTQQAQNQAGLNALYNQYLDQRTQPWTNMANQANLVKALGGTNVNTYGAKQSGLQQLAGVTGFASSIAKNLADSGMPPAQISAYLKSIGADKPGAPAAPDLPGSTPGSEESNQLTVADMVDNGDGTITYTYGDGHTETR